MGTRVLQGVRAIDADQQGPYSTVQYSVLTGPHSVSFVNNKFNVNLRLQAVKLVIDKIYKKNVGNKVLRYFCMSPTQLQTSKIQISSTFEIVFLVNFV